MITTVIAKQTIRLKICRIKFRFFGKVIFKKDSRSVYTKIIADTVQRIILSRRKFFHIKKRTIV